MEVVLKEITMKNFKECLNLQLNEAQKKFVAPNMYSLAEAKADSVSVPHAIYCNVTMVGFIMYDYDTETELGCISRLMVDLSHQGKGYGRIAMQEIIKRIQLIDGCKGIWTSFHPKNVAAEKLYESLGFKKTGEILDGEVVCKMDTKLDFY